MNQADFKAVVQDYVCPILAGAEINRDFTEEGDTKLHELAALVGNAQLIHISPSKRSDYKVEIRRNQVFNGEDTKLIREIVEQIVGRYDNTDAAYLRRVISYAIELGICKFLSNTNYTVLVSVLDGFSSWAAKTYEGRKPTFTIVVDLNNNQEGNEEIPVISDVLNKDFFASLSNSLESGILLSSKGAFIEYVDFSNDTEDNFRSPFRFAAVANYAEGDKICLTLTNNGEALIFKDKKLFFSRRNGKWSYYNHDSIIKAMPISSVEVKQAVYGTILDVSFSRTGGCIAAGPDASRNKMIINGGLAEDSTVKRDDLIDEPTSSKSKVINRLIAGKKFQELSRVIRKELVAIDGATIINYKGEVIAVGAIVKISGGSLGGGRLAATETLAAYGTAIKISADGMVTAKAIVGTEIHNVFEL